MIEAGECWSFVGAKTRVWWAWVALDADTRRVVATACGDRSERTCRCPWDALPDDYRAGAYYSTDFWAAYAAVVPWDRHDQAAKGEGLTNHVERLFNTRRQRSARFVRRTLSLSKKVESHAGSLWFFIHQYNLCRA